MKLFTFNALKSLSSSGKFVNLDENMLKKLQSILLEILDDVVEVCEENNICWFLGGGSALGAMRHRGFIPWDDDVDINMPRIDFDRFIPLFKEKFGDKYWVHTPQDTKNYALSIAKIRKKGTIMRGRDDFHSNECGIGVDIFIIENTYNFLPFRFLHGVFCLTMGYLLSCRKFFRDRKEMLQLAKLAPTAKNTIKMKIVIGAVISLFSVDTWCRWTDNVNSLCKNNNSKFVTGCAGRLHYFGEMYPRKDFFTTKKQNFAGRRFNVPVNVDTYLTHCYGNWKEIPDEDKKEKHLLFEIRM